MDRCQNKPSELTCKKRDVSITTAPNTLSKQAMKSIYARKINKTIEIYIISLPLRDSHKVKRTKSKVHILHN